MKKIVVHILLLLFISSCATSPMQLLDPTDYLSVRNVFNSTDMSIFGGFVDKIPVNRLIEIYGEPDSIFDALESTGEEGYDIYEYSIEGGRLDYYVENITNYKSKNVEFLYFEPDKDIALEKFVTEENLLQDIKEKKCNVYYIADVFGNIIRIRINSEDRNKILNVAYNDCRSLPMRDATIKEITNEIKTDIPIKLSDIGLLTAVDFSDNCLTLCIDVNEIESEDITHLFKSTPSLAEDIAIFLMCDGGYAPFLDDVLVNKNASIKFELFGKKSKHKVTKTLSSDIINKLFSHQLSNERNIQARTNINNCFAPRVLNSWLEGNGIYVEKDTLTMSWTLTLSDNDFKQIQTNFKHWAMGMLADVDNLDTRFVYLAYKCDYYIKFHCKITGKDVELETIWDPDDLYWLLINTK